MAAEPQSLMSREAYLALERESEERHEYIAGEIFAMAGGTIVHDIIFGNVFTFLRANLRNKGCLNRSADETYMVWPRTAQSAEADFVARRPLAGTSVPVPSCQPCASHLSFSLVFSGNVRIAIEELDIYTYPDISVVCGPPQYEGKRRDTVLNPKVLIEILSPSTERYDRGQKFHQFQHVSSFDTYILIAQHLPLIEQYVRQGDQQWLYSAARGLDATLTLPTIECTLALADVYDLVEFSGITVHP